MRFVRILFSQLLILCPAISPGAEENIIEAGPEGMNHECYSEPEGKWIDSRNPPQSAKSAAPGLSPGGTCGSRKIQFWRSSGAVTTAPAAARFTPRFSTAGKYDVYATWPGSANGAPVYYKIRHRGGESLIPVVQDGRGGKGESTANKWVSIGQFEFFPDSNHYVELRLEQDTGPIHKGSFGQIVADAVKFTKAEPAGGAAAVVSALPTPPPVSLRWYDSLDEARDAAATSGKKIFLIFRFPGNAPFAEYEESLLENAEILRLLSSDYVPARLDISANSALAAALGAFRAGTIHLYDSRGNPIRQIADRPGPEEVAARMR